MSASERDLVSEEGVDQGSAASTVEGEDAGASGVLGASPQGAPVNDEQEAGPDPVETIESRRAQDGQQLEVGEG